MEHKRSNKVVYGLFETRAVLEAAVARLKLEGFLSSDISEMVGRYFLERTEPKIQKAEAVTTSA